MAVLLKPWRTFTQNTIIECNCGLSEIDGYSMGIKKGETIAFMKVEQMDNFLFTRTNFRAKISRGMVCYYCPDCYAEQMPADLSDTSRYDTEGWHRQAELWQEWEAE